MAAPTIAGIETALITELREIAGLNVSGYMGQMEDAGLGDAITFPAAWPLYGGERIEWVDGPNFRRVQTWQIVIAAQSYGGTTNPLTLATSGAYAVIESVLAKMSNWKESATLTGIERFVPQRVERMKVDRTHAYYLLTWEVGFDQTMTAQTW